MSCEQSVLESSDPPGVRLVRYSRGGVPARVGLVRAGRLHPLPSFTGMADLLQLHVSQIREIVEAAEADPEWPATSEGLQLHAPIDGLTEVWAAGVTYRISRESRIEESDDADVYRRVYNADRPELFFKAPAWRVVTSGIVGRRSDSTNDTPEPELGLVYNRFGELVGYVVANDMSSRSIEGMNPLYLPQAKIFNGSIALGSHIAPSWKLDGRNLSIRLTISRSRRVVFDGTTSTSMLRRTFDELRDALFHSLSFPHGVILSTGTCLVPPLGAPTLDGDVITIEIEGVDTLRSTVVPAAGIDVGLRLP